MLDYARESLGIETAVADLVYRNAFPLLMQDVTLAMVVDKEVIGGVRCNHLLFSRPGVDFQVWVADGGPAVAAQVCRHRHGNPRAVERHIGHERLERSSGRGRCPVHFRASPGDQEDLLHATRTQAGLTADTNRRKQMKNIVKGAVATALALVLIPEVTYAQAGRMHRATRRRTAVVVGSAASASGSAQAAAGPTADGRGSAAVRCLPAGGCRRQAAGCRRRAAGCRRQAGGCRRQAGGCRRQGSIAAGQPSFPTSPQVASPQRPAAWSISIAAATTIARCFRGTTWCM